MKKLLLDILIFIGGILSIPLWMFCLILMLFNPYKPVKL